MKNLIFITVVFVLLACSSKSEIVVYDSESGATAYVEPVVEEKPVKRAHGFRYTVPEYMEESDNARSFNLRNLLVYKEHNYADSPVLISVRQTDQFPDYTSYRFFKQDMSLLRSRVKVTFDNVKWTPPGFEEKNIDHQSVQFNYSRGGGKVYQRSVYIKLDNRFYIVSLYSRNKLFMMEEKHDPFWASICVD